MTEAAPSEGAPSLKGEAAAAWQEVQRLDAGPQTPKQGQDSKDVFLQHVLAQEKALRRFLEVAPAANGELVFEARFRLARALALRAELETSQELQQQSEALLDELEKGSTPVQQSHINFSRISQWMRRNRFPNAEQRRDLLNAVREFRERYPRDPRAVRLLVEAATQFDREPETKRSILNEASQLNRDPGLKQRIQDEQRKLSLIGKPLQFNFNDTAGRPFKLEQLRGKPVVIIYFSESSAPSLNAWKALNEALRPFPDIGRVAVSLDETHVAMDRIRRNFGENWIVGWDGMSWGSPLVRRLGVNALPTVWLLDQKGRLVSLNALDDLAAQMATLRDTP